MRLYSKYRVAHYWIVESDPPVVEVCKLERKKYTLKARYAETGNAESRLFPGLIIPMAELAR